MAGTPGQAQVLSSATKPSEMEYGGDEIAALVLDPGTYVTRSGFAGEDTPKSVIPSNYAFIPQEDAEKYGGKVLPGDNAVNSLAENLEIRNVMSEGIVQDWDIASEIWTHAIEYRLTSNPREHPLLMTEPAWNPQKNREKTTEFAFETFQVPAFYLAKNGMCAAFSSGKATALIVDVGHGQSSVTPVVDGMILKKGIQKSTVAGAHLNAQLRHQFTSMSIPLTPHYAISSKTQFTDLSSPPSYALRTFPFTPTDSFTHYQQERIFHSFKECTSQVWTSGGPVPLEIQAPGAEMITPRAFEFPVGYSTNFTTARFLAPETLFNPSVSLIPPPISNIPTNPSAGTSTTGAATQTTTTSGGGASSTQLGVVQMVINSLNHVDQDVRGNLLGNIVVTGGTSLTYGFNDRLNAELMNAFPGVRVKINAPGSTIERKYAGWLGGSVLGSLGTFHQMWISKAEYEEVGAGIVEKRCK